MLLLQFCSLLAIGLGLDLDAATKARAVRAFSKLLWLQNDLINRHYAAPLEGGVRRREQTEADSFAESI